MLYVILLRGRKVERVLKKNQYNYTQDNDSQYNNTQYNGTQYDHSASWYDEFLLCLVPLC